MTRASINLSVDVEEWFHAEAVRPHGLRDPGLRGSPRVEQNVDRLLELFAQFGARGTFFVLGEVAARHPALVRRIAAAGHELGTHGLDHELLWRLSPAVFRQDLQRAKGLVEDAAGAPVRGFRAPKFSITDWSLDVLLECGLSYDSSFYAHRSRARYPHLGERPLPERGVVRVFRNGLREVALTLLPVGGRLVPWSGGGFFRLIPYRFYRLGVLRALREEEGFTFFLHPWEIDLGQPSLPGLGVRSRIRHFGWRAAMPRRLALLLAEFPTRPLAEAAAEAPAAVSAGAAG
jgi:polysaccharide deacetylase family protein (PEP-CTERM system associated)